ncbi:MAG: TetR/AcrR family transcriptional regulator [Pseudoxanthomonas sp.]
MARTGTASKGTATREAILAHACALARLHGLEGLTIGSLAEQVGMSKSGVFAHFGSREDLQIAVLDHTAEQFAQRVLVPALRKPRGLERLRAVVVHWFDWVRYDDEGEGGCLFAAAASEYDDRPGPVRDRLLQHLRTWREELARAAAQAVETGELAADTDTAQLAFEIYGIALAVHHDAGLGGYKTAQDRGLHAYARLIRGYTPTSPNR